MDDYALEQAIDYFETPFYLFDTDAAAAQVHKLRAALGAKVGICYAVKANPFLVSALRSEVDAFEACSPGEFRICERGGIPMEKTVMSGVYKNREDVYSALDRYGSRITCTVESPSQWNMLEQYAQEYRQPVRVLLRLTTGNQFGMDESAIREILARWTNGGFVLVEGIQFFSGTQKKSTARMADELQRLDKLLFDLERQCGFAAGTLEYGPGLPVTYFEGEEDGEDVFLQALAEQIGSLRFRGRVVLEIGRGIAASCGRYVTRVVDIKRNRGSRYGIVDGGIHQLNYYGQMLAMKRPPVIHWREKKGIQEPWTICGSLCTMNDVLLKGYPFTDLSVGDCLVFERTGAYSAMEGMALFLSRQLPQIALYSESGGLRMVRDSLPTDTLNGVN